MNPTISTPTSHRTRFDFCAGSSDLSCVGLFILPALCYKVLMQFILTNGTIPFLARHHNLFVHKSDAQPSSPLSGCHASKGICIELLWRIMEYHRRRSQYDLELTDRERLPWVFAY